MAKLWEVKAIWEFKNYRMSGEQTASFAKAYRLRFDAVCQAAGIPTPPARSQDWDRLDTNVELSTNTERKLNELRSWFKGQTPEFAIHFHL